MFTRGRQPAAALQYQVLVDGALRITVETVCQRVRQPVEGEVLPATALGPIQEGTVLGSIGHACDVIGGEHRRA
jgi:hypothetical protein